MRIRSLWIDGFGNFHNQEFGPFETRLTVIEGVNEAGKSTLLAFIRTMLFGWPDRKRADYYPPLNGGRHGGSIELEADDGRRYIVRRWEQSGRIGFEMTLPDNRATDDEAPLRRLLGGTTRETFADVFAFGLDELRGLQTQSHGEIFAAGMGARNAPGALKEIAARREKVFKPGGSKQEIGGILRTLEQLDGQLAAARSQSERYARLTERKAELEAGIESTRAELVCINRERRDAELMLKGWEPWTKGQAIAEALEELPASVGFPENAESRIEAAEEAAKREARLLAEIGTEVERLRLESEAAIADESMLKDAPAIEQLQAELKSYQDSIRDRPKREAETRQAEQALAEQLRGLGPGWDVARLERFDTSEPARQAVGRFGLAFSDAETARRESAVTETRLRDEAAEAAKAANREQDALGRLGRPPMDDESLKARREALRQSRRLQTQLVQAAAESVEMEAKLLTARVASPARSAPAVGRGGIAVLVGSGVVALVLAVALGVAGVFMGIGIAGLAAAAVILLRPRDTKAERRADDGLGGIRRRSEEATTHERALRELYAEQLGRLGWRGEEEADFDGMERSLDEAGHALRTFDDESAAVVRLRQTALEAGERYSRAVVERQQCDERLGAVGESWRAWLVDHDCPGEPDPQSVLLLFEKVERARQTALDLDGPAGRRHRLRRMDEDIAGFEARLDEVRKRHAVPADVLPAAAVHELRSRLASAQQAVVRRSEAAGRYRTALEKQARQQRASQDAGGTLAQLLRMGEVDDVEAFRAKAAIVSRRRELERDAERCREQLAMLSGPGPALHAFEQALSATSCPVIEERYGQAGDRLEAGQAALEELRNERASVETELGQLTGDVEVSRLRAERAERVSELRDAARRWSELALAEALMARALERYERERQPEVVIDAQETFRVATAGRYQRVIPQIEDQGLRVADAYGHSTDASVLSRGTAELLYLSLRFGLVRQFAKREAALPVIVDEVLVNFDAVRGQRVAEAFSRLSGTNQVIVFTCHSWVSRMFEEAGACEVVAIGEAKLALAI